MRLRGARLRAGGELALCLVAWVVVGCDSPSAPSCRDTGICAADEVCDRATGRCAPRLEEGIEISDVGPDLAAAEGPDGVVHVALQSLTPAGLAAGQLSAGESTLSVSMVVVGEGVGRGVDVTVGPSGHPTISFRSADAVRLATFNGTNWSVETVERTGPPGELAGAWRTAVAVDEVGGEVVAYRDPVGRALKIAARQGDGWLVRTADLPEEGVEVGRGLDVSLTMAGGRPVVTHRDGDDGGIRIVTPAETDWTAFEVGRSERRGAQWGWYASASAAPAGNVAVAFQDASAGVLKVALNDRGELSVETADDGRRQGDRGPASIVGAFASLTYAEGRLPMVAYQDGAAGALMLAERDVEGRWRRRVLDDRPVAGHGIALVALSEGGPVVIHRRLSLGEGGRRTGTLAVVRP